MTVGAIAESRLSLDRPDLMVPMRAVWPYPPINESSHDRLLLLPPLPPPQGEGKAFMRASPEVSRERSEFTWKLTSLARCVSPEEIRMLPCVSGSSLSKFIGGRPREGVMRIITLRSGRSDSENWPMGRGWPHWRPLRCRELVARRQTPTRGGLTPT